MIRLLTAVLFLIYSHFGWAMAYPEDYNGVPHGDFKEGDVIDHTKFNQNNSSIKDAINDRVPVPSNCTADQIIKYDGGGWVCTDMPSAGGGGGASTFIWRDANGNLFPFFGDFGGVVYKFPESEYVFAIWYDGDYRSDTVYFPTSDCSGDGFMVPRTRGTLEAGRSSTHWLVPDYSASPTEFPALGAGNWSKLDSNGCQAGTNSTSDASIGDVLPVIQSSAPLNPITAPVELIWAD